MATNHTQHYQLNLWEPTDKFVREEFNENNQKIDAALKAEADARTAADTALQTAVNAKASITALNAVQNIAAQKSRVVVGSYIGNGQAARVINLGFRPQGVFIHSYRSEQIQIMSDGIHYYGGVACDGIATEIPITVVDQGFRVERSNLKHTNDDQATYIYFAFC